MKAITSAKLKSILKSHGESPPIIFGSLWLILISLVNFTFARPGTIEDMTGDEVAVTAPQPIREKYALRRRFTVSLSKYLNAQYKLNRERLPMRGNCIASSLLRVSEAGGGLCSSLGFVGSISPRARACSSRNMRE